MNMTIKDRNATYETDPAGYVKATLRGDKEPKIFARDFLAAKAAVEYRVETIRSNQINRAWEARV